MIFETIATGGCMSYLIGCPRSCGAVVIDPELSQEDRYRALAAKHGLRVRYVLDTHTHADHFSASRALAGKLGVPIVMHRASPAPFVDLRVDDGESLVVGDLRFEVIHTPGHTADSMCVVVGDRVLTGDTLLIGGTGRTDLPSGDPNALYDSLFSRLLTLDPSLTIYPAHNYKHLEPTTLGHELASNPRLQQTERAAFVAQMEALELDLPRHLTEALRTNQSGGKTVAQLIQNAADKVPFMSMGQLRRRIESGEPNLVLIDVREKEAFERRHITGARHIPRGQLELRVNDELPDPTQRVVLYCQLGMISTLAAATLHDMGFGRAVALDGGFEAWNKAGFPCEPT